MYADRKRFYQKIEGERNSKVIAYVTGDRPGMGAQIGADTPDIFLEHLDVIGKVDKISLIIYTCGGDTLAAWNIINLFREFCNELEVIVPNKCRSSGTLMALGANSIVMTKQATLGPIDPSITRSMSPIIPNSTPPQRLPISVESVKGYFSLLKEEFGASSDAALSAAYTKLAEYIHPLVLGDVYRTQKQIQMLAEKLLRMHNVEDQTIKHIVSFLCSDSGSHDYTINRTEARNLGLSVETPTQETYNELKAWFMDVVNELELRNAYDPAKIIGADQKVDYLFKRCLIESVAYGQDAFISEGTLIKDTVVVNGTPRTSIGNNLRYEGWRHF
ncbi:serine protease [Gemmiger formicilis]|uniref:SDH family Clp fold serine proteinase n=1 Tax=Gemmiger formicilis TaxID=745368 RepID=UPI00195C3888|nr:serine protease [Gemmiger formicilis]MBM6916833.1 serine protease [Gemmiger formicilis]